MTSERNLKFRWSDAFTAYGPKKPATFRVGVAMSNKDNGDGKGFFASAEELAGNTPYTLRPVKAAITELLDAGWIERTRKGGRAGDGVKWASEYRLSIPSQGAEVSTLTPEQGQSQGAQSSTLSTSQGAEVSTLTLPQGAHLEPQGAQSNTPLDPVPLDPPNYLQVHGESATPEVVEVTERREGQRRPYRNKATPRGEELTERPRYTGRHRPR